MRPLLILGSRTDPHIRWVVEALGRDVPVDYFDFDDISCSLTTSADAEHQSSLLQIGRLIEMNQGRAPIVWLRNKYRKIEIKDKEDQYKYFRYKSLLDIFISEILNLRIDHSNPIKSLASIENKIGQLRSARRCGLRIPKTIVTNSKPDLLEFICINGLEHVIAKPPCMGVLPPALDGSGLDSILANRVSAADVHLVDDYEFAEAPFIYQEEVDKAYEIRAISTRMACAGYKIDSQNSELGQIDSRRATFEKIYSETILDPEVGRKLREYVAATGLQYGVFDLAVSKAGEVVFLECNPDGQWAWLEQATGSTRTRSVMAEMLAELLRC